MKLLARMLSSLLAVVLLALGAVAQDTPHAVAQDDPEQLVAQVVRNELAANRRKTYWMYVDSKGQGQRIEVRRVIETPECWLSWPLSSSATVTAAQEEHQRQDLYKLVNDPEACHRQRAEVDEDNRKANALLRMLPNAFLYAVEGRQDGKILLKFRPNPRFHPPTREAKVFHSMQGTLVIEEREMRLVSIEGTLMSDVNFGGGILGKLHKGGTFKVVQSEVAPEDWEVTRLDVHINGRALFFKTISEEQHEVKSDFHSVPPGLSLVQAASIVQKGNPPASASADHTQ